MASNRLLVGSLLAAAASLSLAGRTASADPQCPPEWIEIVSPEDGSSFSRGSAIPVVIQGEMVNTNPAGPRAHFVMWRVYNSWDQIVLEGSAFVGPGDYCVPTPFEIRDLIPGSLPSGHYVLTVGISENIHSAPIATARADFRVVLGRVTLPSTPR